MILIGSSSLAVAAVGSVALRSPTDPGDHGDQPMTSLIVRFGALGVFALMVPESACIPLPSEVTLLFSGLAVHKGWMSFQLAALAATGGNLLGSLLAYGLGATRIAPTATDRARRPGSLGPPPRALRHSCGPDRPPAAAGAHLRLAASRSATRSADSVHRPHDDRVRAVGDRVHSRRDDRPPAHGQRSTRSSGARYSASVC